MPRMLIIFALGRRCTCPAFFQRRGRAHSSRDSAFKFLQFPSQVSTGNDVLKVQVYTTIQNDMVNESVSHSYFHLAAK